jgi:hypothetical protein
LYLEQPILPTNLKRISAGLSSSSILPALHLVFVDRTTFITPYNNKMILFGLSSSK